MKAIYAICTLAAVAMAARCIARNNKLIDCRSVVYPRITTPQVSTSARGVLRVASGCVAWLVDGAKEGFCNYLILV